MALPQSAMGWSAVCDCGISRSYSLVFYSQIELKLSKLYSDMSACTKINNSSYCLMCSDVLSVISI